MTSSICWVLVLKRAQKYCYVYPWRWNQDPAPRLHYCFLAVPPLSLHPWLVTVVIVSGRQWSKVPDSSFCLPWLATVESLELGGGHGGWSLFPTNKKQGTWDGFRTQEPHRVLLGFHDRSIVNLGWLYKDVFPRWQVISDSNRQTDQEYIWI